MRCHTELYHSMVSRPLLDHDSAILLLVITISWSFFIEWGRRRIHKKLIIDRFSARTSAGWLDKLKNTTH